MGPFAGIRVLDLSRTRVGAQVSQFLADFGAEVVLVEPPGGAEFRRHAAFPFWTRGKKSIVLDLREAGDRETIAWLAGDADVLIESFRRGVLDDLGLGYEALGVGNPGLIYASITGFGARGPYADAPGYEGLAMAKLGLFSAFRRMNEAQDKLAYVSAPFASYSASQVALQGVLAALHERQTSGCGQKVEASLAQSLLALDTWAWIEHVLAKRWPDAFHPIAAFDELGRPRSHLMLRLLVAMTSDGNWLQFACTAPKLFAAKMRALGLDWMFKDPDWSEVPMFEDPDKAMACWTRMLESAREKSIDDWCANFDADSDLFAEQFRGGADILEHPQLLHDAMSVTLDDPERGAVRQPGPLVKASRTPAELHPAPRLDEHRAKILSHGWGSQLPPAPKPRAPAPRGKPLEGVTIIELATMFAAPMATTHLTDLGARVIKIEPLEGDPIRNLITVPETGGTRVMQGKESICVDIGTPEGVEIVRRIAAKADVVVQGFRAGVVRRLGLAYQDLKAVNPKLIYVNAPGYGVDGPYGGRPAYAPSIGAAAGFALTNLGIEGMDVTNADIAQIRSLSRRLNAATGHTIAQADGVAALGVATAILFGLYARDHGAGGQELFTSMLNSGAHMMSAHAVSWDGAPREPMVDEELRGLGPLYRIYDAAEGLVFLAAPSARDWDRLVKALRPHADLSADARFNTQDGRGKNGADLADALAKVFLTKTAQAWEDDLLKQGVGCMKISEVSLEAVLMDTPLGRDSGYIADVIDPTFDETPRQATLVRFSRSATQAKPPVLAGQHTDAILSEFGFGEAVERLRQAGVVV